MSATTTTAPKLRSKTDTLIRLRQLARDARTLAKAPANGPAEVGFRVNPQHRKKAPATKRAATMACYPKDDDLATTLHLDHACTEAELRVPGAVAHLYLYEPGKDGELVDIVVVWLGYGDEAPRVIDPRFATY